MNFIKRFVLDVNVLMDALLYTGPLTSINEFAELKAPSGRSSNAIRVMRGVAQQVVSGQPDYQVHVSRHVWKTLEYKLVNPTMSGGRPAYTPWSPLEAYDTVAVLTEALSSMEVFGWTVDMDSNLSRAELQSLVPTYMIRDRAYDIDINDDCRVIADAVAVAALQEWETTPVVTFIVTNDGGLQLANEWLSKKYQSFAAEALPMSFGVMFPARAAGLMEKSTRSAALVAA